jgi:hypothetical protein
MNITIMAMTSVWPRRPPDERAKPLLSTVGLPVSISHLYGVRQVDGVRFAGFGIKHTYTHMNRNETLGYVVAFYYVTVAIELNLVSHLDRLVPLTTGPGHYRQVLPVHRTEEDLARIVVDLVLVVPGIA